MEYFFNQPYGLPLAYLAVVLWTYFITIVSAKYLEMPSEVFDISLTISWIPLINIMWSAFLTFIAIVVIIAKVTEFIKNRIYK